MSLSTDIRAFVHEVPSAGRWAWELEGPEHSLRVARNTVGPGGSLAKRFRAIKTSGDSYTEEGAASEARVERAHVLSILTVYNHEQSIDEYAKANRKQVAP